MSELLFSPFSLDACDSFFSTSPFPCPLPARRNLFFISFCFTFFFFFFFSFLFSLCYFLSISLELSFLFSRAFDRSRFARKKSVGRKGESGSVQGGVEVVYVVQVIVPCYQSHYPGRE